MPWYYTLYHDLTTLFSLKDCIEIALASVAIYYFSVWLKADRQKNLLFSFYGYCAVTFGCYYAGLPTLTLFLFITAPLAIMLFILFHQDLLQKNFIALASINAAPAEHESDWLETVIRACLVAINNNKTIYGVIEHRDSLSSMLTTNIPLYTDVQKNVLTMALESSSYDQEKMLWLTAQGKLLGINSRWNVSPADIITSPSVAMLAEWQQEALFFTHKTDAIVFSINPTSRTFTLIAQGKIVEHINANHALNTIKKFLSDTQHTNAQYPKGDKNHEIQSKKHHSEQRNA